MAKPPRTAGELLRELMHACGRCGHRWLPRMAEVPRQCPACHSPYWNVARQRRLPPTKQARRRRG